MKLTDVYQQLLQEKKTTIPKILYHFTTPDNLINIVNNNYTLKTHKRTGISFTANYKLQRSHAQYSHKICRLSVKNINSKFEIQQFFNRDIGNDLATIEDEYRTIKRKINIKSFLLRTDILKWGLNVLPDELWQTMKDLAHHNKSIYIVDKWKEFR